jgi:hypothetical protein
MGTILNNPERKAGESPLDQAFISESKMSDGNQHTC